MTDDWKSRLEAVTGSAVYEVAKTAAKLILRRQNSFSQFGEDLVIGRLAPQRRGHYVDVGAFHPHLYSNTYLLYRRGWSGVAIDPNPRAELLFRLFRPRDRFLRFGIGPACTRTYYRYNNGAYNGFAPAACLAAGVRLLKTFDAPLRPLRDLVDGRPIDFLNVDVEGMEVEVLATLDWRCAPKLVAVEGDASAEVLSRYGYELATVCGLTRIWRRESPERA